MCVLLGIFSEFPVDPYYEPLAWFMITTPQIGEVASNLFLFSPYRSPVAEHNCSDGTKVAEAFKNT